MLINQDFILLILNCVKYREKALKQKETWLNILTHTNLLYFHVIGNSTLVSDYVFDNTEKVTVSITDSIGREQNVLFLTELGLY